MGRIIAAVTHTKSSPSFPIQIHPRGLLKLIPTRVSVGLRKPIGGLDGPQGGKVKKNILLVSSGPSGCLTPKLHSRV